MTSHIKNHEWRRTMFVGLDMAMENARKGSEVGDTDIIWALLKEAAEVSRLSYAGPPRTGMPAKSTMPETCDEVTAWQMMSAYIRGEISDLPSVESRPPQPSAAQISRAEAVLWVWHHVALKGKGDWSRIRKAVYMKACGVPDRKIRAVTGFSRSRIHRAKEQAMADMAEFIYGVYK